MRSFTSNDKINVYFYFQIIVDIFFSHYCCNLLVRCWFFDVIPPNFVALLPAIIMSLLFASTSNTTLVKVRLYMLDYYKTMLCWYTLGLNYVIRSTQNLSGFAESLLLCLLQACKIHLHVSFLKLKKSTSKNVYIRKYLYLHKFVLFFY